MIVSWRWYVAAILAGAVAAAVVWSLPIGPLWRSPPRAGRLEGFSPDGQILVTTNIAPLFGYPNPQPELCRWDAATGQLLGRVKLASPNHEPAKVVRPSADGQRALVGESSRPYDNDNIYSWSSAENWYLHDGITGRRLAKVIIDEAAAPGPFSDDGRWFWISHNRKYGPVGVSIFSAASGEVVLDLRDERRRATDCSFAPDGTSAAVIWRSDTDIRNIRDTVQIVEVPSGQERCHFDLPGCKRQQLTSQLPPVRIDRWDGRHLRVVVPQDAMGQIYERRLVFDTLQDPLAEGVEEPFLSQPYSQDRLLYEPGWLAQVSIRPFRPQPPREWLSAKPAIPRPGDLEPGWVDRHLRVCSLDPATGSLRYEVPQLLADPLRVSPDGRLLACASERGAVEVWETLPPRRWPQAVAAGLGAASLVFLLALWRRRWRVQY